MPKIGHLVNGQFVTVAKDFDILDAPECTETTSGFMTPQDKEKLNKSYTTDDVATKSQIDGIF